MTSHYGDVTGNVILAIQKQQDGSICLDDQQEFFWQRVEQRETNDVSLEHILSVWNDLQKFLIVFSVKGCDNKNEKYRVKISVHVALLKCALNELMTIYM